MNRVIDIGPYSVLSRRDAIKQIVLKQISFKLIQMNQFINLISLKNLLLKLDLAKRAATNNINIQNITTSNTIQHNHES